eukprot:4510234-Amphidinium_carterae.1
MFGLSTEAVSTCARGCKFHEIATIPTRSGLCPKQRPASPTFINRITAPPGFEHEELQIIPTCEFMCA